MSWFKRKTVEEKKRDLEAEVKELNEKHSDYFNQPCLVNGKIRVYEHFRVKDNKIMISFIDKDTPEGKVWSMDYEWEALRWGDDFILKQMNEFLTLQHSLKALGFKITKI